MIDKEILGKKIIAIGNGIDGPEIILDDGTEFTIMSYTFPDGSFRGYRLKQIKGSLSGEKRK